MQQTDRVERAVKLLDRHSYSDESHYFDQVTSLDFDSDYRVCPFCAKVLFDPDESMGHFFNAHKLSFEPANDISKWMWVGTKWEPDDS